MSIDKSLKVQSALARPRSVLSRIERLAQLREEGRWTEEKSVYGIPKVRVRKVKRKVKAAAKPEAGAEAATPGAEAPKAAAPAGGKK